MDIANARKMLEYQTRKKRTPLMDLILSIILYPSLSLVKQRTRSQILCLD